MGLRKPTARIREEFIVEAWRRLKTEWVGAAELESIQRSLKPEFGESSPASIARTLAEHGASLRHAEVLSVDTSWRICRLTELFLPDELDFKSIDSAAESMQKLDELQLHFNSEGDEVGLARLRDLVVELKTELKALSDARLRVGLEQQVASEVTEWLTVWLQTPDIFPDWLELRRASGQFRTKFGVSAAYADATAAKKDA